MKIACLAAATLLVATASSHAAAQNPPRHQIITGERQVAAPYSPAVRTGNIVFFAGTIGSRPGEPAVVPGGIGAETRQALENLRATARTAGMDLNDMVKCTVFLSDIDDFAEMNKVYAEFFPTNPPARSTVGVAELVRNARIEVECIGVAR